MSTPDETSQPLTRRQLRELKLTGQTPVISAQEIEDARVAREADEAPSAADDLLDALIAHARPSSPEASDALLLHGVYDLPKRVGVDEGTLWGDYFYLEALVRRTTPGWERYW